MCLIHQDRYHVPKRRQPTTNLRPETSQDSQDDNIIVTKVEEKKENKYAKRQYTDNDAFRKGTARKRVVYRVLVGKPEGKRPNGET